MLNFKTIMLFRCTERKYAEALRDNGTIKFNTAEKWIEYEKKEAKGRGDLTEGIYASCNALDFCNYNLFKRFRKDVTIEQYKNQKVFRSKNVVSLLAFCLFGLHDTSFDKKMPDGYDSNIVYDVFSITNKYFHDFLNSKTANENEEDEKENQCVIAMINNPHEFFERIYKYFNSIGIDRNEILIRPVEYIDKNSTFYSSLPEPQELFLKDNSFSYQSEVRVVINSKNKKAIKKIESNNGIVNIGNLQDLLSIEDYHYEDMMLCKRDNYILYGLAKPIYRDMSTYSKDRLISILYQLIDGDKFIDNEILVKVENAQKVTGAINSIENILREKHDIYGVTFHENIQEKYMQKRISNNRLTFPS